MNAQKVLQCKDPECARENEGPFSAHVSVDRDGGLAENVREIPGDQFECCICQSPAEWVDESP